MLLKEVVMIRLIGYVFTGWIIAGCLWLPAQTWGDMGMKDLEITLDGRATPLAAKAGDGEVLVPLDAFCALVGAEAKVLEGDGPLAVCREELCVPLNVSGDRDTLVIDGTAFARLDAFGEPLGLSWKRAGNILQVTSDLSVAVGLGIGQIPPDFALPDLFSGDRVALRDYRGKKAVFYMWASW